MLEQMEGDRVRGEGGLTEGDVAVVVGGAMLDRTSDTNYTGYSLLSEVLEDTLHIDQAPVERVHQPASTKRAMSADQPAGQGGRRTRHKH